MDAHDRIEAGEIRLLSWSSSNKGRDASCPVCGQPLGHEAGLCPHCETPHHQECWAYNGGCGIYACGARTLPPIRSGEIAAEDQAAGREAAAGSTPAPDPAPRPPARPVAGLASILPALMGAALLLAVAVPAMAPLPTPLPLVTEVIPLAPPESTSPPPIASPTRQGDPFWLRSPAPVPPPAGGPGREEEIRRFWTGRSAAGGTAVMPGRSR